ncbi:conserved hypothetical protein [Paraburkholderia tropica]
MRSRSGGLPACVGDHELARDELEFGERVRDLLLVGERGGIDGAHAVTGALERHFERGRVEADQRRQLRGDRRNVVAREIIHGDEFVDQRPHDLRLCIGELAGREVILHVVDEMLAVGDRARIGLTLDRGEIRVPDHPGIDAAARERGARIGGREINGLNILVLEIRFLERFHEQIVHVRAFIQGHALAAQIGDRANRRILRDHDGFALRRGRLAGDIDEIHAASLRENRRRLANRADIDRARIEAFEQLRTAGELQPLHRKTERRKAFFERAARFQYDEIPVLLKADAQHLVALRARRTALQRECGGGADAGRATDRGQRGRARSGFQKLSTRAVGAVVVVLIVRHRVVCL